MDSTTREQSPSVLAGSRRGGVLKISIAIVAASVLAASAAGLYFSWMPADRAQPIFESIAGHSGLHRFTPAFFASFLLRLRLFCIFLIVLSLGALACAGTLAKELDSLFTRLKSPAPKGPGVGRWEALVLFALFAAGIGLRSRYVLRPVMWDEATAYWAYASRHIFFVFSDYHIPYNNHILHTLLMWIGIHLLGDTLFALRLPAFLAGVALLALIYVTARGLYDSRTAVLALALAAGSPGLIEYSVNSRGYSLLCCFTLLLILAVQRILEKAGAGWTLFTLASIGGFYTMPTMLLPWLSAVAWLMLNEFAAGGHALRAVTKPLLKAVAITAIATILLYSPALILSGPGAFLQPAGEESWHEFVQDLSALLKAELPFWYPVILAVALVLSFFQPSGRTRVSVTGPFIAVGALFALARWSLVFPRFWTYILPVLLIAAASGLSGAITMALALFGAQARSGVVARWVAAGVAVACAMVLIRSSVLTLPEGDDRREMLTVGKYLDSVLKPDDTAIIVESRLRYDVQHRCAGRCTVVLPGDVASPKSRALQAIWLTCGAGGVTPTAAETLAASAGEIVTGDRAPVLLKRTRCWAVWEVYPR